MRLPFVTISMFLELDRGFPIQGSLGQLRTLGLSWVGPHLSIPEIPESSAQAPGPMYCLRNFSFITAFLGQDNYLKQKTSLNRGRLLLIVGPS